MNFTQKIKIGSIIANASVNDIDSVINGIEIKAMDPPNPDFAIPNKIIAGIHNMKAEYAQKMINKGFQLVTVGSDQRFKYGGAKEAVSKFKKIDKKEGKVY